MSPVTISPALSASSLSCEIARDMQTAHVSIVPLQPVLRPPLADVDPDAPGSLEPDVAFHQRSRAAATADPFTLRAALLRTSRPLCSSSLAGAPDSLLVKDLERLEFLMDARVQSILAQIGGRREDRPGVPSPTGAGLRVRDWQEGLRAGSKEDRASMRAGVKQLLHDLAHALAADASLFADHSHLFKGLMTRDAPTKARRRPSIRPLEFGSYLFLVGTFGEVFKRCVPVQAILASAADLFETAGHYDAAALISEHAPWPADASWRWLAAIAATQEPDTTATVVRIFQGLTHAMAFGNWHDAEQLLHRLARLNLRQRRWKRAGDNFLRMALMQSFLLKQEQPSAAPKENIIASLRHALKQTVDLWARADEEVIPRLPITCGGHLSTAPLERIAPTEALNAVSSLHGALEAVGA